VRIISSSLFVTLMVLFRSVTDFGGKGRVMELMAHENSDVRYRALLSVQQLVSQPWVTL
jgi:V-ATPase subunit H